MTEAANVVAVFDVELAARRDRIERLASDLGLASTTVHGGWVVGHRPVQPGHLATHAAVERETTSAVAVGSRDAPRRLIDGGPRTLTGDDTFVAARRDGSLVAVRAAAGHAPLYWWTSPHRLVVSSRTDWLIRCVPGASPDLLTMAAFTSGWPVFPDQRAFVSGARALEAGHTLELAPGVPPRITRYWSPWMEPEDEYLDLAPDEVAAEVRRVVLASLEELEAGANLMSLSGGVDSSTLVTLGASNQEKPIHTVSMVFDRSDSNEHYRRIIETTRLAPIASASLLTLDHAEPNPYADVADVTGVPTFHPILAALPSLQSQLPFTTYAGGEFADDTLGGEVAFPDWARRVELWRTLRLSQNPNGARDVARWLKYRTRSRSAAIPHPREPRGPFVPAVREEWVEWQERVRSSALPRPRAALRAMWPLMDAIGAMNWEFCSRRGIRRLTPFVSRPLVELSARLDPQQLIGPGHKRPLRAAFRADVPAAVLARPKRVPSPRRATDPVTALLPPPSAELRDRVGGVFTDEALLSDAMPVWDRATITSISHAIAAFEL